MTTSAPTISMQARAVAADILSQYGSSSPLPTLLALAYARGTDDGFREACAVLKVAEANRREVA